MPISKLLSGMHIYLTIVSEKQRSQFLSFMGIRDGDIEKMSKANKYEKNSDSRWVG